MGNAPPSKFTRVIPYDIESLKGETVKFVCEPTKKSTEHRNSGWNIPSQSYTGSDIYNITQSPYFQIQHLTSDLSKQDDDRPWDFSISSSSSVGYDTKLKKNGDARPDGVSVKGVFKDLIIEKVKLRIPGKLWGEYIKDIYYINITINNDQYTLRTDGDIFRHIENLLVRKYMETLKIDDYHDCL